MKNSPFRDTCMRIALDEMTLGYKGLMQEKNLMTRQQQVISMMREMHLEFDLSVMSSSDEPFSREVIFLYHQLAVQSKAIFGEMDEKP